MKFGYVDVDAALGEKGEARERRERIVKRAAKELKDGYYVNLGTFLEIMLSDWC